MPMRTWMTLALGVLTGGKGSAHGAGLSDAPAWAASFGNKLSELANDDLGTTSLQARYDNVGSTTVSRTGTAMRDDLSSSLEGKLGSRLNVLASNADETLRLWREYNTSDTWDTSLQECCNVNDDNWEYNGGFKGKVNDQELCQRYALNTNKQADDLRRSATVHQNLLSQYQSNLGANPDIKWQYFGSAGGNFAIYPATKSSACANYDNRFRPWYVAANTEPKHVVLVVDSSGSMTSEGRWAQAQDAVITVLDTLGPDDRVFLLDFDSSVHTPLAPTYPSCFSDVLVPATNENKALLRDFILNSAIAAGGTNFAPAFTQAYDAIKNTRELLDDDSMPTTILFLTDGRDAGTTPAITAINTAKSGMVNPPSIYTYAFGDDIPSDSAQLLLDIATQNDGTRSSIADGTGGTDQNLRTQLGSYYSSPQFARAPGDPVFSVPYFDASGLGLVTTLAQTVFDGDSLLGVVGVDLQLAELLEDVSYFVEGRFSYAFVMDGSGRTFAHPNLPQLSKVTEEPVFIQASVLEPALLETRTGSASRTIYDSMKAGETGDQPVTVTRALARGDLSEGPEVVAMPGHISWKRVPGTELTVAVVLAEPDLSTNAVTLRSVNDTTSPQGSTYQYHRLDRTSLTQCGHAGQSAVSDRSTIQIAPRGFTDSERYLETAETAETVQRVSEINAFLGGQRADPAIRDDVQRDAWITHTAETHWLANPGSQDFALWRYVGTPSGLFRQFPGHRSGTSYDATQRPWYLRAAANVGSLALSTPYEDASGAGKVITLSKAIEKANAPASNAAEAPAAVMGVDLSLEHFAFLLESSTGCNDPDNHVVCFLMDGSGFFVMHPAFLQLDFKPRSVFEQEPRLAKEMIQNGFLVKKKCNDYRPGGDVQAYYQVGLPEGTDGSLCEGQTFTVKPVPGANVFLVVVEDDDSEKRFICYDPSYCSAASETCAADTCTSDLSICEPLCSCELSYNLCTDEFEDTSLPTCPVPDVIVDTSEPGNEPVQVPTEPCFTQNCLGLPRGSCFSKLLCDFCVVDENNADLDDPYCTPAAVDGNSGCPGSQTVRYGDIYPDNSGYWNYPGISAAYSVVPNTAFAIAVALSAVLAFLQ